MKKNINGESKGFTLVEVLIAMAIFAFASMGLLALQLRSINTTAQARRMAAADELANFPIESFRGTDFQPFDEIQKWVDGLSNYTDSVTGLDMYKYELVVNSTDDPVNDQPEIAYVGGPGSIDMFERTVQRWFSLFVLSANTGSEDLAVLDAEQDEYMAFRGTGTLRITIARDTSLNQNLYADVWVRVGWCDEKGAVTRSECNPGHWHSVTASQRFSNGF